MLKKWHLLYKTICIPTGKHYVGIHSTNNIEDGYLGSGIRITESVSEYGRRNHRREILQSVATREELLILEKSVVTKEMILDPMCLNLGLGGGGPSCLHPDSRKKISEFQKGKIVSEETRRRMSEGMKGKPKSKKHRAAISKAALALTENGKTHPLTGVPKSEEHKQRLSEAMKKARARK